MLDLEEIYESSKESWNIGEKIEDEQAISEADNTSSNPLSNPNNIVLTKFRTLVTEYLNGEIADSIDILTKGILGSYSLAGYLDFALPSGKEIIITKLLQQCCFLLQDLLRCV